MHDLEKRDIKKYCHIMWVASPKENGLNTLWIYTDEDKNTA